MGLFKPSIPTAERTEPWISLALARTNSLRLSSHADNAASSSNLQHNPSSNQRETVRSFFSVYFKALAHRITCRYDCDVHRCWFLDPGTRSQHQGYQEPQQRCSCCSNYSFSAPCWCVPRDVSVSLIRVRHATYVSSSFTCPFNADVLRSVQLS